MSTESTQTSQKGLDVALTATHQVHVSKSFVNSLQEETADKAKTPSPLDQLNEPSAWLDAHGNECECVGCEMLTLDYIFPDPPPHWGKNKPHWYCSGGGQSGWEQHERERRWITACLAYYGHPRHKEDWNDITTEKVAAWVECQGMGF
ncbi:MAG: hypothetical protein M1840_006631 [Geoglossum simile]|nr:MAG: hypothetical protein M1840_006631 [Geoglossum simile]